MKTATKPIEYFCTDHLQDDLKRNSIRGLSVTLFSQGFKFLFGLASTIVLARLLTPKDYGILAIVGVITGFVGVLRDGGLSIATIQRDKINDSQISTLFWINLTLGVILGVIVVVVSPAAAWLYDDWSLMPVIAVMGLPFIIGGGMVQHQALLSRQMRFSAIATIDITSLIGSALVGILLAYLGFGYWALVIMTLAFSLMNAILVFSFCRWKPKPPVRGSGVRSMLKFGGVLTINHFLDCLGGSADKLLLSAFVPPETLGLYARAQSLMLQPFTQLMPVCRNVALPALSRLASQPDAIKRIQLELLQVTAFACSFLSAYTIVCSGWLIGLFLGSQWSDASTILQLFSGTMFALPLSTLLVINLTIQGKSKAILHWGATKNASIIFAVLIGLFWGPNGVAMGLSIASLFILMPILIYISAKAGPASVNETIAAICPGFALSILVSGLLLWIQVKLELSNPLTGLVVFFITNVSIHLFFMSIMPSGKRAIANVISFFNTANSESPSQSAVDRNELP